MSDLTSHAVNYEARMILEAETRELALKTENKWLRDVLSCIADRADMADEYTDVEAAFRRAGELARAATSRTEGT